MMVAIILAVYGGILLTDFRKLAEDCPAGVKVLYLALTAVSFLALMLHELGVTIPSPSTLIEQVVGALFGIS